MTLILGIETSCDETSAAVIERKESGGPALLSLVILSQDVHAVFGGVVPEIAARAHLTSLVPVADKALADAAAKFGDLDAIAVTHAPGLIGALLAGVSYGKALAFSLGIPVVAVHHMEGHLFAASLEDPGAEPPFMALLVSGGHTMLIDCPEWGSYELLGATRDDAAGEAFDKVAKLLGLPYPGGRYVEELAARGTPGRFRFKPPMLDGTWKENQPGYHDVSFSGLKTAVLNAVRASTDIERDRANIARGFQDALIETLVEKTVRAADDRGRSRIVLGGGVACNRTLVAAARKRAERIGATVHSASPRLSTDNAAMIARAGLFHFERGERADMSLNAFAMLPIPGLTNAVGY
ncbi:MAG: tRNA (adenosine(37)-N6)-threonylcarbamoyltransferase complex transferase subunit TsaD [Gemmatimonadaceae bacterium]